MACKTVYLKDRSRSLLYDKLIDNFKDSKMAVNMYHNINSLSGDLLFNADTIRDRNGEPLPLFPILPSNLNSVLDNNSFHNEYTQFKYTTKPNGNEPIFINSKTNINTDDDVITISDDSKVITMTDLENTFENDDAFYDTDLQQRMSNVSGQKQATDINNKLSKKGLNIIKFEQSTETDITLRKSQSTIKIDFGTYSNNRGLNTDKHLLMDLINYVAPDTYKDLKSIANSSNIPLFDIILSKFSANESESLQDELLSGLLSNIAYLNSLHDMPKGVSLFDIDKVKKDLALLQDRLAGSSKFKDLSKAEQDNINLFINRINNIYNNDYSFIVEHTIFPTSSRKKGYMSVKTNKLIHEFTQTISNKDTIKYAKSRIKNFKQKVSDKDVITKLKETHLPYITQKRQQLIQLLKLAQNNAKFNKDKVKDLQAHLKKLNEQIDEFSKGESVGAFLESLYYTLISDISNISIIEDFADMLEDEYLNRNVEDFTFKDRRHFAAHANLIRQFVAAYNEITNLTSLTTMDLPGYGKIGSIIQELEQQIKGLDTRVSQLRTRYAKISDKYIDLHASTVRGMGIEEVREHMANAMDISSASYALDSLMDVSNIFAAQVKKNYTKHFNKRDLYIKNKTLAWDDLLRKHFGSNWDNDDLTEKRFEEISDEKGRIITEINEDLFDELKALRMELEIKRQKGDNDPDYIQARNEYYEFISDNFEREYKDEFYTKFPDVVLEKHKYYQDKIDQVRNEVVNQYGSYKPKYLTSGQKDRLDAIYAERREFMKADSDIAKQLKEMYGLLGRKFIKSIHSDFYNDYDEAKAKGRVEQDIFLMRNTIKSDTFNERLEKIYEKLTGNNPYKKAARGLQRTILDKYRDRDGIVNMSKLTKDDKRNLKLIALYNEIKNINKVMRNSKNSKADDLDIATIESVVALLDNERIEGLFTTDFKDGMQSAYRTLNRRQHPYPTLEVDTKYGGTTNEEYERAKYELDELVRNVETDYYHNIPESVREREDWIQENTYINGEGKRVLLNGWTYQLPKNDDINDSVDDLVTPKTFYKKTDSVSPEFIQDFEVFRNGVGKPLKTNPKWEQLSDDNKAFAKDVHEFMLELQKTYNIPMIEQGMLPSIRKGVAEEVKSDDEYIQEYDKEAEIARNNAAFDFYFNVYQDTSGQSKYPIPLRHVYKISQKKYLNVRKKRTDEKQDDYLDYLITYLKDTYGYEVQNRDNIFDEIIAENKERKTYNEQIHKDSLNMNVAKTMKVFIGSVANYTYSKDLEDDISMSLAIVGNMDLIQDSIVGTKNFIDKGKDYANTIFGLNLDTRIKKEGKRSRLYMLMESDIRRNFYGRYQEPTSMDKYLKAIRTYTSVLGMGLNVFSAVKNVMTGSMMTMSEARAGTFFSVKDYNSAMGRYWGSVGSYLSDDNMPEHQYSTFENALINTFNIVDEQIENNYMEDKKYGYGRYQNMKGLASKAMNKLFFMQSSGEHMMQNATLFAMLKSHKIQDGRIISFEEYILANSDEETQLKYDIKDVVDNPEMVNKIIANSKQNEETLRKEFNELPNADDYFVFEKGRIDFNPKYADNSLENPYEIMEDEFAEFKIKVQGVNHKIHGVYNKSDRGLIEESMWGQLLMQYKHWMRAGWTRRMGNNGIWNMKANYNVRRSEYTRGSLKTLIQYLRSPLRSGALSKYDDSKGFSRLISKQIAGFSDLISNTKMYWHAMERWEQQEAIRAITDMIGIAIVGLLYMGAKKLADLDDELKDNPAIAFAVYSLSGLYVELSVWTPIGIYSEGRKIMKAPMALLPNADRAMKLAGAILLDLPMSAILDDPEIMIMQTGKYHGRNKIGVYASQLMPVGAQYLRWATLSTDNEAYSYY